MSTEIPPFWQQQAELLDLQADQHLQTRARPPLDHRFMTYCVKQEGDASELILHLEIESHVWKLIRREGVGISWEIYSPDHVISYTTNSQIENRLDREILDFRARLLASEQWEEKITQRLSLLRRQLWQWPAQQILKLYWIEWEGFKQREERGWATSITPDAEGFVTLWQGSMSIAIQLDQTHHFIKRYQFHRLKDLPQELIVQRHLTIRGLIWQKQLYAEVPGEILRIPIGLEPIHWIVNAFKSTSTVSADPFDLEEASMFFMQV